MQSITVKIELITIRNKNNKKQPLTTFFFFFFPLLTILPQVGCTRALKVIANGQSILDCSHPEIHCYSFHLIECLALLGGQEFTLFNPATQGNIPGNGKDEE